MSRAFLCVSVEATADPDARGASAFDGVYGGLARRLVPLLVEHRARATILAAREVLDDARALEVLASSGTSAEIAVASRAGDRVALRAELRASVDAFIRAFGHQPTSHRALRGAHRGTIEALDDLGFTVDGSVTPRFDAPASGLDLLDAPAQPYRADRADAARPGPSRIIEVPVTVGRRRWGFFGCRRARHALAPREADARTLAATTDEAIAEARRARPGAPVVVHGVVSARDLLDRECTDRVGALLAHARATDLTVIGLSDVPEIVRL